MTFYKKILSLIFCLTIAGLPLSVVRSQSLYTPFPSGFRNTNNNELLNEVGLRGVFEKIKSGKTVKVMHIGDSHVKGNSFPRSLGNTLKGYFPNVSFVYYGINGAWARRFYEHDMVQRVATEDPDLVIVSFGTNEAHGSTLDERVHSQTMTMLTSRIQERCPGVAFLFTTPPGSYISQRTGSYKVGRGRRRRTRYITKKVANIAQTERVSRSIVSFCNANNYAVWDLFTIAGGQSACSNWLNGGYMASDQVHYMPHAYTLQGKWLGEAIHKAYSTTSFSGTHTRLVHGSTPQEQKPYNSMTGM